MPPACENPDSGIREPQTSTIFRCEIRDRYSAGAETLAAVRRMFDAVDGFMNEFMQTANDAIEYERNGAQNIDSPLKFFTHVITHECHHKGQILSLGRSLGYIPVDTDVLR